MVGFSRWELAGPQQETSQGWLSIQRVWGGGTTPQQSDFTQLPTAATWQTQMMLSLYSAASHGGHPGPYIFPRSLGVQVYKTIQILHTTQRCHESWDNEWGLEAQRATLRGVLSWWQGVMRIELAESHSNFLTQNPQQNPARDLPEECCLLLLKVNKYISPTHPPHCTSVY